MVEEGCECDNCQIHGKMLSPEAYIKVKGHDLRKKILHTLYVRAIDGPLTKQDLADEFDLKYEAMNYQLNEHLSEFWMVKDREKIRGTYKEYLAPKDPNTIYLNVGANSVIFMVDPLAGRIGRLEDVGTRCDDCTDEQKSACLGELGSQDCMHLEPSVLKKRIAVLKLNGRDEPLTPVDHLLLYTAEMCLDCVECNVRFSACGCNFIEKVKRD